MKMVRSLLLGTAAGLVAMTGAQAADLPVKAKPVAYVKICDLYGAGYYYIPGTDTCIKIGGYVRANFYYNAAGTFNYSGAPPFGGDDAFYNRAQTKNFHWRARAWLTADVRSQTAYGTLRSYTALQFTNAYGGGAAAPDSATGVAMLRAFIQFAGFTVGRATSLTDLPDAHSPVTNNGTPGFAGSTGPTGINVLQYTAQFGNGVSASIGIESSDQRDRAIYNISSGGLGAGIGILVPAPMADSGIAGGGGIGSWIPDITANIDVTQAWGSARIAGALHHIGAAYYNAAVSAANPGWVPPPGCAGAPVAGTIPCGSPGDEFGYALLAGFTITQVPGVPGLLFGVSGGFSSGASAYTLAETNVSIRKDNAPTAAHTIGLTSDAWFVNGGSLQKTNSWYVTGAVKYAWAPNLASSIFGGYTSVDYNGTATGYACAILGLAVGNPMCDPDYSYWQLGVNVFTWTPVQNLNIGLDIVYNKFHSGFQGAVVAPTGPYTNTAIAGDNDVWMANLQITRSFWP